MIGYIDDRIGSDASVSNSADTTFRVRKGQRNLAIACLIFFVLMGIGSAYGAWIDVPPDRRIYFAAFLLFFWGFWAVLCMWALLSYWYQTLTIQNDNVIHQGVIRRKEFVLKEFREAIWRRGPTPRIKLRSSTEKLTVDFDNYEPKERLCLIRYFRNGLAEEVQTGWDMFCHSVANPLRDYVPEGVPTPSADEVTLTRRRWDWYFIPLILLSAVFGIVAWWKFQLPRMLAAPLLPTALWLFLRFGTPKQGMVARRISADPEHKRWLVFLLSWFCVGMVGLVVFKPMNPPRPHDIVAATVGVILWFVGLFLRAYLLDRGMQQRKSEAANVSVQQWNDGDPSQDE